MDMLEPNKGQPYTYGSEITLTCVATPADFGLNAGPPQGPPQGPPRKRSPRSLPAGPPDGTSGVHVQDDGEHPFTFAWCAVVCKNDYNDTTPGQHSVNTSCTFDPKVS